MTAIPFDTLRPSRKLRDDAHMPQDQAEGIAKALSEEMAGVELVTKEHFDSRLLMLEQRITIKIGAMMVALAGFLSLIKFFGH